MNELEARVIVSVLGSAVTVLTLATVSEPVRSGPTRHDEHEGSHRAIGGSPSTSSRMGLTVYVWCVIALGLCRRGIAD